MASRGRIVRSRGRGKIQKFSERDLMALAWFARRAALHNSNTGRFNPRAEINTAYDIVDSELAGRSK